MFIFKWSPGFCKISFILFYFFWLRSGLLSEHIRGEVYATGRLAHAHCSFTVCFEIFASGNQLKNALKTNFLIVSYYGCTYFLHASIIFIVKPRTYFFSMILHFILFILFSFYQSISFLIGLIMMYDILLYLLILC